MTVGTSSHRTGPAAWIRHNLLRTPWDAIVSVLASLALIFVVYRLLNFVFITGRWEVVRVNLTLFMVGAYDRDELWRPAVALMVVGLIGGVIGGVVARRQRDAGEAPPPMSAGARGLDLLGRLWPAVIGVAVLLGLTETITPTLVVLGAVAAAVAGRFVGAMLPARALTPLIIAVFATLVSMVWMLAQPVGWDDWGGLMLNVFLAATSLALCFPLGVLLALGRRSQLPIIRLLSTAYIEIFRGVPLIALLLMANVALGFFIPQDIVPGKVVLAIITFTLFTAAYVAEIVRGGLQSVPRGQIEAGQAQGMSPVHITFLIVLPQALRNVIPAMVGQFISLFKDTTLAGAAMGFLELLATAQAVTKQSGFSGQGLIAETLIFVSFIFWVGSFTMSRESQRLEQKLGVGER